jgi:hypothetical protein
MQPKEKDMSVSENEDSPVAAILAAIIIIGTVIMAFFFFMAMDDIEKDPGNTFIEKHELPP